ncbi:Alpha/beta hydrolase fold-1 [Arabidopsis suecica]|jgi:pimeloyl-ACP methyl ester carboxylesterase|uniref:Pheophytinase, chloroplastic n=4 Tax=Arabidopsis TaxID=3701 RepID=PPH_ARATH|nr:pheophytinase [Arabidopsis thaliana]NP_850815.1 pheophytinase [Arabidopsis thaliana]Q9FFZ1.1 RecName: Full=Pheophytinase, chloroplastic; AltName: Full=Pheophytin pheophorbide hydrolase; AltName: Full=Protein CO-REGULATED WITH NYE1; Flags: Precursor [Arabidopsis thaliana]KAG7609107.1 Alpha/beta hydrolase fold-1 [Arabidopsis suecica]AAL08242.1 AT5g13800/MAC12_25 [Arabidopsis thaliana]AAL50077.1 AT5g13800/MAC12_25 [Arabidopsis thaliana]AAN31088.1 At5g13800/MAC12_25 [Arabidopsis thaliana]AED9|eukprot:NP_196884.1 pheophytinase [Arabidopsis thaliana]
MEIISLNVVPQCSVVTWSSKLATKRLVPNRSSLLFSGVKKSRLVIRSGNSDGYVVGENDDLGRIARRGESTSKVLIPGLPDESNGEIAARISHSHCEWKPKLRVHYEKAGCDNLDAPAVLFLPGFGVGSFHYEKQLTDLGRDYRVWAIDFLGQGLSLPTEDPTTMTEETSSSEDKEPFWGFGDKTEPWADQLVFSLDLWRDQVQYFVEEVIGEPVYIAGNSLGGYVALYFAATHPHLVKGVTLLNATPFWGFFPNPVRSPKLARLFPWPGAFPLPERVKKITELVWQKISDPESIAEILKQVYTDHSINVDKVFSRIVEVTQHPAAAASFASIMLAPGGELSFSEALSRCKENNVQICLMYGREDPWVRPLWGKKIKKEIPNAPYYEISPAGHCPHDEVPEVVNYLMRGWIKHLESGGFEALPLLEDTEEDWEESRIGREIEFPRDGWKKAVNLWLYGSNYTYWRGVRESFRSSFIRVFGGKSA